MKLAEALALRSDLNKSIDSLRERITLSARYQEGETPAEDATALLSEAAGKLDELQRLITAINVTNSALTLTDGQTLTAALAARDVLRLRHGLLTQAAQAGAGGFGQRQMRSELRQLTAVDVPALREQAAHTAQALRELDGRIQEANWTQELLEI